MTTPDVTRRTGRAAAAERPAVGHRFVVVSLVLAALLLIPGIVGRLGMAVSPETTHGVALATVWAALDDIRFGAGVRFWLGVGGTVAMALLLLYPLRKALAGRRFLGSIAAWFKVHLLIGIFAPVAILYHTNFSTGGLNANVALWTMLVVAASGIVGHFVYARASAAYYGDKQAARRNLDGALSLITSLGGAAGPRDQLAARLDAFDAAEVMPRQGIRAALAARRNVARSKRDLILEAVSVVDLAAREMRLDQGLHARTRAEVAKLLHAYFAFGGRAASHAVREQLWARWRMFHLPLFLVMCGATALHVLAVWDMDGPGETPAARPLPQQRAPVAAPADRTPQATAPVRTERVAGATAIQQVRRASVPVDGPAASPPVATTTQAQSSPVRPLAQPVARPKPLLEPQSQALARADASPVRTQPSVAPAPAATPAQPPAVAIVASPPRAVDKPTPGKDLYEELQKRTAGEPSRMALGGTRSLAEQIETYKAKMRTREFKHSDAETGFTLTGKHTRADCSDCHTAPLKEVRSDNPRQCIACHKKDDVHKGRRPDCADCHTTNSFRERKKKR